jgi:hypothetical protein
LRLTLTEPSDAIRAGRANCRARMGIDMIFGLRASAWDTLTV